MLDAVFGSTPRVKILNLLLLASEKKYPLTQLVRDLGLPAGTLRHELANLVKFGLVREEKIVSGPEGKSPREKKYFLANVNFILYPELKALFVKAQILFSQKFLTGLQKISQPRLLALTGFFTNYPESPTDLLFVGTVRRTIFLKLMKELEKELGREINFTILSEKEFRYREEIMDIFLYNIIEGRTLILIDNIHKTK